MGHVTSSVTKEFDLLYVISYRCSIGVSHGANKTSITPAAPIFHLLKADQHATADAPMRTISSPCCPHWAGADSSTSS